MKIGDIVTMKHALTPERYGLGLIQKIVPTDSLVWEGKLRAVYHILWPDETISCQYDDEIVLVGKVE
jgi:hypothetical protein